MLRSAIEELQKVYKNRREKKNLTMVNFNNVYANTGQGYYPVDLEITDDKVLITSPEVINLFLTQNSIINYDDEVGVDTVLLELTFVQIPRLTLKFPSPESKGQFVSQISQVATSSDSGKSSDGSSEPEPEGP